MQLFARPWLTQVWSNTTWQLNHFTRYWPVLVTFTLLYTGSEVLILIKIKQSPRLSGIISTCSQNNCDEALKTHPHHGSNTSQNNYRSIYLTLVLGDFNFQVLWWDWDKSLTSDELALPLSRSNKKYGIGLIIDCLPDWCATFPVFLHCFNAAANSNATLSKQ